MVLRLAQQVALIAFPHGGQHGARSNALASVRDDSARARERADVHAWLRAQPDMNSRTARPASTSANSLRRVASD